MNIVTKLLSTFNSFNDKVAISKFDTAVTYKTLYEQGLKVASYIISKNIKHSCIAIEIDDTANHIICIIGVILSGNYYISVTEDNKSLFFTQKDFLIALVIRSKPAGPQSHWCLTDEIFARPFHSNIIHSLPKINPQDKICAFFTSGSTGSPKIVVHNHNSIFNQLMREIKENEITYADKLDFVFSLTFSASLSCIFPALLTGAELCIYNIKEHGLSGFVIFLERNAITFTTLSVTTFHGICKVTSSFRHLSALRFISISAEPVKDTTLGFFYEKFPTSSILQIAYASTETRTISDLKLINDGTTRPYTQSIGKPVAGKDVFIIDDDGAVQQNGGIGEIVVQSQYIADSYFGAISENSPFLCNGDDIQYKTGDIGYLNNDGYLFYLGRKQNEIKLNGIKINIREIENEIEKLPFISKAVTVINKTNPGQPKLVCFFQTSENTVTSIDIKKAIEPNLPATHLPGFYIKLDNLPLTHTGKTDRKALEKLPINDIKEKYLQAEQLSDPNGINYYEAIIIDVFKRVLEIENISADDNFFDMGGDSLTSLFCAVEIENELKITFPPLILLSYPTPARIAAYLNQQNEKTMLINCIAVNNYLKERQDLYFINSYISKRYDSLINNLSGNFNIIGLHYDLQSIHEAQNSYELVVAELSKIISRSNNAVVVGHSFDGYIAHQLACIIPQISYCVLIDTFDYFDMEKYKVRHNLIGKLNGLKLHVFVYKDYPFPLFLAKKFYQIKYKKNKAFNHEGITAEGREHILKYPQHLKTINNCIYFQASRSYFRIKDHGDDWRMRCGKAFHFINLVADHSSILKKHAVTMADFICKAASEKNTIQI